MVLGWFDSPCRAIKNNNIYGVIKMLEVTEKKMKHLSDLLYGYEKEVPTLSDSEKHKAHILSTRVGGFGFSDAGMIIDIGRSRKVLPKYYRRLGVFAGVVAPSDFSNKYMDTGNQREGEIFEYFRNSCPEHKWIHNPIYNDTDCTLSEKYKCFSHIDIVENCDGVNYNIYEVKTSKDSIKTLLIRYDSQLKWHCVVGGFNKITLVHYAENWDGSGFDASKIEKEVIVYSDIEIDDFKEQIWLGFRTIEDFLSVQAKNDYVDLRAYNEEKEVVLLNKDNTPDAVAKEIKICISLASMREQISNAEEKHRNFIYSWMVEDGIQVCKHEDEKAIITFTNVKEGFSITVDTKRLKEEQPDICNNYSKETFRKGHLKVVIKNKEVSDV